MKYFIIAAVVLAYATMTLASTPKLITYQGRLTDPTGAPVADGDYVLIFKIWTASSGGSLLWSESQTVTVTQSFFDIVLGSVVPIEDDVLAIGGGNPDPSDRYLEISVGSESLSPRERLAAVPYASAARRMSGDIFTGEGRLKIRNLNNLSDSAAVDISAGSSGSNIRMIGGGTPEPGDLTSVNIWAEINQASLAMIGGGNPDPGNSPNFGVMAGVDKTSLTMIGGGQPDPADSPRMELTTDGLLQRTTLSMIGGGNPDPGQVSLELRSARDDSARVNISTSGTSMGIELRNSADQVTAQLSGGGLGLFVDAGSSSSAPIGTRFRDNAVVAWGNVQAAGSLVSDFGVLNVTHPSSGQYTITLNNSASNVDNLIPSVIAEVASIPVTATAARLVTVNQLTPNSFAVYITNGGYTPVDNNFVFMVTAR